MNIPPFLERLLLSNEAVFKNATLGLSGMNLLDIPPGKTGVILEVSIEPFFNTAQVDLTTLFKTGQINTNFGDLQGFINERLMFQLQIVNDAYQTHFSFHNKFAIKIGEPNANPDNAHVSIENDFEGFREELFIYVDRPIYFNILYPYLQTDELIPAVPGLTYRYGTPAGAFAPLKQNLPSIPYAFKDSTVLQLPVDITNGAADSYFAIGKQFLPVVGVDAAAQTEYFKLLAEDPNFPNAYNSVVFQNASDDGMQNFAELYSLPLVNVKYALLNKRPADYGLTKPSA
jgi:hypothetical protein